MKYSKFVFAAAVWSVSLLQAQTSPTPAQVAESKVQ